MEASLEHQEKADTRAEIHLVLQYELLNRLSPFLREQSLTFHQYILLVLLRNSKRPMQTRNIASLIDYSASATTCLIDRMECRGFALRSYSAKDRRVVFVSITKSGTRVLKRVCKQRAASMEKLLSSLTNVERRKWIAIHEKIFRDECVSDRMMH